MVGNSRLGQVSSDSTGDFAEVSETSLNLFTLFNFKRALRPKINFGDPKPVIPSLPAPLGQAGLVGWLLGPKRVGGSEIDNIRTTLQLMIHAISAELSYTVAGPKRPPPIIKASPVLKLPAKGKRPAVSASGSDENVFTRMTSAAAERGFVFWKLLTWTAQLTI
jgi:hypothetical protein